MIPVRNDLTFLDLTVQQIEYLNKTYDADVPLVLMNRFMLLINSVVNKLKKILVLKLGARL